MKDDYLDKEAALNYIKISTKDEKWRTILKESLELCYDEVKNKASEIEAKLEKLPKEVGGIKKDQCNIKLLALNTCFQMESFSVV